MPDDKDKKPKKIKIAGKEYLTDRSDAPKGLTRTKKEVTNPYSGHRGSRGKYRTEKLYGVKNQAKAKFRDGASPNMSKKASMKAKIYNAPTKEKVYDKKKDAKKALIESTGSKKIAKGVMKASGQKIFVSEKSRGLKRDIKHNIKLKKKR